MSPVSQPFRQISLGKVPSSSSWPATGTISLRANSRAVSINCCCSSEKSKLGIAVSIRLPRGRLVVLVVVRMPSQYLDEFIRELRRDGDTTFSSNHGAPVIIVTRAEGEMKDANAGAETTVMAETSGWRIQQVSLINRVFAVSPGAFEKAGPIVLGRGDTADIVVPD